MGYYTAGGALQMAPSHQVSPLSLAPPDAGASSGTASGRKRPTMNPMNIRAARRAVRRLDRFAKLARKVYTFTHKGHAGGHFKRPKKRSR